jgi:hypothetical protein
MWDEEKYDEFVKDLETKYPEMFAGAYGGVCTGAGWWPIIQVLCFNIQSHINWLNKQGFEIAQVTVSQIKEKFGGLRFYYDGGDDTIDGMVQMAESWAARSCETCGNVGKSRSGGWIRTLCDEHANSLQNKGESE